jgi:hypothetical protein
MHISYYIGIIKLRIVDFKFWRHLRFQTAHAATIRTAQVTQVTTLWVEPVLVRICREVDAEVLFALPWTVRLYLAREHFVYTNMHNNKEIYTYLFCGEFKACRCVRNELAIIRPDIMKYATIGNFGQCTFLRTTDTLYPTEYFALFMS